MHHPDITRARFADGELLAAAPLRAEQAYVDRRFAWLGRLLGRAVVDGLHVRILDCEQLVVEPGSAIDDSGEEIVLVEAQPIKAVSGMVCIRRAPPRGVAAATIAPTRGGTPEPIIVAEIAQAEVSIVAPGAIADQVPIAFVRWDDAIGWIVVAMPRPPRGLHNVASPTTIALLSWQHGAEGSWPPWIEFSTPVWSMPPQQLLEFHPADRRTSVVAPCDVALDPAKMRLTFAGNDRKPPRPGDLVIVRLACDFILDMRGVPVAAGVMSGPGGLFESWFRVSAEASR
jgi:hypothetical protein